MTKEERAELRARAEDALEGMLPDDWYTEKTLTLSKEAIPDVMGAAFIAAANPAIVLSLLDALDAKEAELAGFRAMAESIWDQGARAGLDAENPYRKAAP